MAESSAAEIWQDDSDLDDISQDVAAAITGTEIYVEETRPDLRLVEFDDPSDEELDEVEAEDEPQISDDVVNEAIINSDYLRNFMNQVGKIPLLDGMREERELAIRIEAGDSEAKKKMILANLRLVIYWSKNYQNKGVPIDDLISEGVFGLIRATEKFDYRRGFKFSTYSTWWIRQAQQRALANQGKTIRVPVHVVERVLKIKKMERNLAAKLERFPSKAELKSAVIEGGMEEKHFDEAVDAFSTAHVPIDKPGEDGHSYLHDVIPDTESNTEEEAEENIRERALLEAMERLPERERLALRLRYGFEDGEPKTLEQIARIIGVTREWVRQIELEAFKMLRNDKEFSTAISDTDNKT